MEAKTKTRILVSEDVAGSQQCNQSAVVVMFSTCQLCCVDMNNEDVMR